MPTKTKSTPKVTIYLSREGETIRLHLRDSEGHVGDSNITTDVCCGDEVEWVIEGGIDEITNIYPKHGSKNIFSTGPERKEDGSWMGTVSSSVSGSEFYSIDYKIAGQSYSDDPKLKVKPPQD